MRLSELIEKLEAFQDAYPGKDPEVRLAIQPSWPFEYSIHSISSPRLKDDRGEDDRGEKVPVVYLSEGSQLGYLPRAAQDAAW